MIRKSPKRFSLTFSQSFKKFESVWLHIEKNKEKKEQFVKLITEGDIIQMSDKKAQEGIGFMGSLK